MKKKRKLLIATDSFLPRWDGISRFLDLILPELAKKFEVTVLAPEFEGKAPQYKNVNIIRFPLSKFNLGGLDLAKPNRKIIKKEAKKTDILFAQIAAPIGIQAMNYAKKFKKPIVNYNHTIEWELAKRLARNFKSLIGLIVKIIARRSYNKSSLLLVPSILVEEALIKNEIKPKKQILPLGVDTDKFLPAASKSNAKKKIGISPNYKVIGFTGRVGTLEKDLPTLIQAFQKIKKKFPKIKLLLVGEVLTEDFPKHKDIIYAGVQEEVAQYLQAMDIFVMPSLIETNSLATMEAMSTGCAVVATPVGSIPEYVIHKTNGLIFP